MLSQAHPLHHDPLEMPDHVIGQEEGAKLAVHLVIEGRLLKIHLVTMRAWNAHHIFSFAKSVDPAARSTIASRSSWP